MLLTNPTPVAWSTYFIGEVCKNCKKNKTLRIVQSQKRIGISGIKPVGMGHRSFHKECSHCKSMYELNKQEVRIGKKEKYYSKRPSDDSMRVSAKDQRKYPLLKPKKWEELRKENIKEGYLSMGIGVIFGLMVMPFFLTIGVLISLLSLLGGLYAAYEDPEKKFRTHYDKTGQTR